MATFGRYLISLSATLSSWFLRFVWGREGGPALRKFASAIGDVEDAPEAGRDVTVVPVKITIAHSRGAVFDLRDGYARGQRGCDERVSGAAGRIVLTSISNRLSW